MSRLVALFQKGFMRLTGGKRVVVLANDEFILDKSGLEEIVLDFSDRRNETLMKEVEKLKEMSQRAHSSGYKKGLESNSKYTLLLPAAIREENKHLVDIVSLIAGELLDQGDVDSCKWLFKKIHQCRSL